MDKVTVTDEKGRAERFEGTQCFAMVKSAKGTWHITEVFGEYFVIYAGD